MLRVKKIVQLTKPLVQKNIPVVTLRAKYTTTQEKQDAQEDLFLQEDYPSIMEEFGVKINPGNQVTVHSQWRSPTLEWTIPSPPPAHTFEGPVNFITTDKGYKEYRWNARIESLYDDF